VKIITPSGSEMDDVASSMPSNCQASIITWSLIYNYIQFIYFNLVTESDANWNFKNMYRIKLSELHLSLGVRHITGYTLP